MCPRLRRWRSTSGRAPMAQSSALRRRTPARSLRRLPASGLGTRAGRSARCRRRRPPSPLVPNRTRRLLSPAGPGTGKEQAQVQREEHKPRSQHSPSCPAGHAVQRDGWPRADPRRESHGQDQGRCPKEKCFQCLAAGRPGVRARRTFRPPPDRPGRNLPVRFHHLALSRRLGLRAAWAQKRPRAGRTTLRRPRRTPAWRARNRPSS